MKSQIIQRKRIAAFCRNLHKKKKRIVFTNGVFDILHRGHVEYLARAKSFGDVLMVGLNTDLSVRRIKGAGRPVQKQQDRAIIVLALESVDFVVLFSEDRPDKLIRQVRPDVLVKGADYKLSEIAGAEFVQSYGGEVRRVPLARGRSTTALLKRLP
jgi:rfaE bifunctional protein nucleotidyltransferase chain/domain